MSHMKVKYCYPDNLSRILAAAEAGEQYAQWRMGEMLAGGFGFEHPDRIEAMKWYELAAAQGLILAERSLGNLLIDGPRKLRDEDRGWRLLLKAARANDYRALYRVAKGAFDEHHTLITRDEASEMLTQARRMGHPQAAVDELILKATGNIRQGIFSELAPKT